MLMCILINVFINLNKLIVILFNICNGYL